MDGGINMSEYRDDKTRKGSRYEVFIYYLLKTTRGIELHHYNNRNQQYTIGENKEGIEIKYDMKFRERRPSALWIEYKEKADIREGKYAESGILRRNNTRYWLQGDYKDVFIFKIGILRELYAQTMKYGILQKVENQRQTSLGYLLPLKDIGLYTTNIISVNNSLRSHIFNLMNS